MGDVEDDKRRKAKDSMIERMRSISASGGKPPIYDMIGKRLRDYYDGVAAQPVPERFLDLLKQLESKTSTKKGH